MATEEDLKKAEDDAEEAAAAADASGDDEALVRASSGSTRPKVDSESDAEREGEGQEAPNTPLQLGYQRYVYAAYMAGALAVAFLAAKIGHVTWYRLGQWKPELGEPADVPLYLAAGVVGIMAAVYYWRKESARQYANEVAEELSKVTWPTRKEVMSSTTVVILTTIFATVFFALMDQFWKYLTDKIYSF